MTFLAGYQLRGEILSCSLTTKYSFAKTSVPTMCESMSHRVGYAEKPAHIVTFEMVMITLLSKRKVSYLAVSIWIQAFILSIHTT